MKRGFGAAIILMLFLTIPSGLLEIGALPRTIVVPNDYPTIQEAINAANNGDTIHVSAGRYYEGILVNKSVAVVGDSPETTTVYGTVEGYQPDNVGNPFDISVSNVIIENLLITRGDEYHGAIRASAVQNIVIRNNVLGYDPSLGYYSGIGIAVEDCSDFSIVNNTIQGGGRIEIRDCKSGEVSENTLTGLEYSMLVYSSANMKFVENSIFQCDEGIQLTDSANCTFSQNKISSIIGAIGVSLSKCPGSVLTKNQVTNCTSGISLSESGACTLRDNVIAGRPFFGWGGSSFSVLGYKLEDFLMNIDVSNTVDGKPIYYLSDLQRVKVDPEAYPNAGYLALVNCRALTVEGFSLGNCSQGILLAQTTDSQIKNNTISNSNDGIYLEWHSNGNLISGNHFEANSNSIRSYYCLNNTIFNNNMTESGTVWIDTSINSLILDNSLGGIKLVQAENIVAYHNNFMKSSYYLGEHYTSGPGYPAGGSYHIDYVGEDLKSGISQGIPGPDGIGDTAYFTDLYPLMAPIYLFEAGTWSGKTAYVELESNSTISDFRIDGAGRSISFSAFGSAGSVGFVRAGIPRIISQDAWRGNYQIVVNGKSCSYTIQADAENDYAYASYLNALAAQNPAPPGWAFEFPLWAILLLVCTLVVVVLGVAFWLKKFRRR